MIDQGQQIGRRQHRQFAGPDRFAALLQGTDQTPCHALGRHGHRQHARHRGQGAIQIQLSHRVVFRQFIHRQHVHGQQQPNGDGQIIMAAFLGQIGGRQIGRDTLWRQGQSNRAQGAPHSLPALSHRLVRQPDNGERRQAGGKLHLHVHRQGLNTLECHRPYMGHRAPTSPTINASFGCMKL